MFPATVAGADTCCHASWSSSVRTGLISWVSGAFCGTEALTSGTGALTRAETGQCREYLFRHLRVADSYRRGKV